MTITRTERSDDVINIASIENPKDDFSKLVQALVINDMRKTIGFLPAKIKTLDYENYFVRLDRKPGTGNNNGVADLPDLQGVTFDLDARASFEQTKSIELREQEKASLSRAMLSVRRDYADFIRSTLKYKNSTHEQRTAMDGILDKFIMEGAPDSEKSSTPFGNITKDLTVDEVEAHQKIMDRISAGQNERTAITDRERLRDNNIKAIDAFSKALRNATFDPNGSCGCGLQDIIVNFIKAEEFFTPQPLAKELIAE